MGNAMVCVSPKLTHEQFKESKDLLQRGSISNTGTVFGKHCIVRCLNRQEVVMGYKLKLKMIWHLYSYEMNNSSEQCVSQNVDVVSVPCFSSSHSTDSIKGLFVFVLIYQEKDRFMCTVPTQQG